MYIILQRSIEAAAATAVSISLFAGIVIKEGLGEFLPTGALAIPPPPSLFLSVSVFFFLSLNAQDKTHRASRADGLSESRASNKPMHRAPTPILADPSDSIMHGDRYEIYAFPVPNRADKFSLGNFCTCSVKPKATEAPSPERRLYDATFFLCFLIAWQSERGRSSHSIFFVTFFIYFLFSTLFVLCFPLFCFLFFLPSAISSAMSSLQRPAFAFFNQQLFFPKALSLWCSMSAL